MFNIENDQLITKRTFIKRSGVSRTTLDARLKDDPDSPKKYQTPVGEMYIASEVSEWLRKLDPKMRISKKELDDQAVSAIGA